MSFRYYKRAWDEPRGDPFDSWGSSVWYFEVDEASYPVRQLERYEHGPGLKYSSVHVEDFYGGLGDQPLDREEFAAFEISKEEFDEAWSSSSVIGKEDPNEDYNAVFSAISRHDADALRAAIASGVDVDAPDPRPYIGHMNTPLHNAANNGDADLVRILLEAGADVDARCADGWTPLMRACNAGLFEVAKLLVEAGADIDAKNSEGYTAYDRVPGDVPELVTFMGLHDELLAVGVMPQARIALRSAAGRPAGMVVICGPAGAGKTTLAEVLKEHATMAMLGDLRMPEDIVEALRRAERDPVVGVVRSGESLRLSSRWHDMGIPHDLISRASVTTVTLRRLPRAEPSVPPSDVLIVEVLGPSGDALTPSLAEEAKALVSAGIVSDHAARFHVPGYE